MNNIKRTPNTRAVFLAALENLINYSNYIYETCKEACNTNNTEGLQEIVVQTIENLDGLYFIFRYPEKDARIESDGLHWKTINQAKANLCRIRNKLNKPSKMARNTVSVRTFNKNLSLTTCYSKKVNTGNNVVTNRHMMVFDVIATELSRIIEIDHGIKQKSLQYAFKSVGEVERFLEYSRQGVNSESGDIIAITITNDKFRKITGLKIEKEKIKQLIKETSELNISCRFSFIIGKSVYESKNTIQDVPFVLQSVESPYNNGKVTDEYYILLNLTPMGCFIINNLITQHFDMISSDLYSLSGTAQNIYRKAIIYSYRLRRLSEESIKNNAGISNTNNTSARNIIIKALSELKESRLIDGYTITEGRKGRVYNIYLPSKKISRYYKGRG